MTEFMRGRRLRTDERLRKMVQETHMDISDPTSTYRHH